MTPVSHGQRSRAATTNHIETFDSVVAKGLWEDAQQEEWPPVWGGHSARLGTGERENRYSVTRATIIAHRTTRAEIVSGFDKFGWLKALQADTAVTDAAFRIGVAICTRFTWSTARVGIDLDDLATETGRAFVRNTVKAGVALLVSRGYVSETYRSLGGRGVRARVSFDLKPACPDVRGFSLKTRTSGQQTRTSGQQTRTSGQQTRTSRRASLAANEQVGDGFSDPQGVSTGFLQGLHQGGRARTGRRRTEFARRRPPPRKCPEHINDASPPKCGPCKDARLAREDYDKDHPQLNGVDASVSGWLNGTGGYRAALTAAERKRENNRAVFDRAACDLCDEKGWVLGDDGTVLDRGVKMHPQEARLHRRRSHRGTAVSAFEPPRDRGRCPACGWHRRTMGHKPGCLSGRCKCVAASPPI